MNEVWVSALCGGLLIGISVSIMLLFTGNVTGISGIFYGSTVCYKIEKAWKPYFLLGMIIAGLLFSFFYPEKLKGHIASPNWTLLVAGLLVGYGTRLGNGCTSGHGVCGVSRFSLRSIFATLTFLFSGMVLAALLRNLGWIG